jgi:hypothetical protein
LSVINSHVVHFTRAIGSIHIKKPPFCLSAFQ